MVASSYRRISADDFHDLTNDRPNFKIELCFSLNFVRIPDFENIIIIIFHEKYG